MTKQKGKVEETDKVALRIKQEVLKELRARQSGGHLKVILLPNEKDLEEAINIAISKTRDEIVEGIFEDINQATRKKPSQDILDVMEKWRKNVKQGYECHLETGEVFKP